MKNALNFLDFSRENIVAMLNLTQLYLYCLQFYGLDVKIAGQVSVLFCKSISLNGWRGGATGRAMDRS